MNCAKWIDVDLDGDGGGGGKKFAKKKKQLPFGDIISIYLFSFLFSLGVRTNMVKKITIPNRFGVLFLK